MAAVCSMTTLMRVYTLRIYSAVILVLAIGSLKMKQTFDFFFVLQYKSSGCVLNWYGNSSNGHFINLGFG